MCQVASKQNNSLRTHFQKKCEAGDGKNAEWEKSRRTVRKDLGLVRPAGEGPSTFAGGVVTTAPYTTGRGTRTGDGIYDGTWRAAMVTAFDHFM
jgi:hypothetical protein